jgi:hypothetical protein
MPSIFQRHRRRTSRPPNRHRDQADQRNKGLTNISSAADTIVLEFHAPFDYEAKCKIESNPTK